VYMGIILKSILRKEGVSLWNGFEWFRIGSSENDSEDTCSKPNQKYINFLSDYWISKKFLCSFVSDDSNSGVYCHSI